MTGSSSGIGAATARAFAAAGVAALVLHGRNEQRLQAVADAIRSAHPQVKVATLLGDIGVEDTHVRLVAHAVQHFGGLHIVFNNAGGGTFAPLTAITGDAVDAMLAANVKSVIFGLKHQLPALGKSASNDSWGVVINNSSNASTQVKSGFEAIGTYAASKAAVDTLSQFGALEGAPLRVRVLAINPGATASEGAVTVAAGGDEAAFRQYAGQHNLIPDAMSTGELATIVAFLADNKTARYITGSSIKIDGGMNIK